MTYPNGMNALKQYGSVGRQSAADSASPHRLIQMLLEGALEKIAVARGAMERKDVSTKGRHISWAISIIEGLRSSLDMEAGGELAGNLNDLYDYMERRLIQANQQNSLDMLDEVKRLIGDIKEAWDGIPESERSVGAQTAPQNLVHGQV